MLEKNKFYIGAWYGIDDNIVDSRRVKEIRDNGIDFIFTDNYHNERSEEVLRLCKENGVQCILFDREYYQRNEDFTPETVEVSSDHIGNPACIGHAIYDEPPKSLFKKISRNRDVYLKRYPDKFAYINLNPIYANEAQLGTDSYEDYIDSFINEFDCDYISVDNYPLCVAEDMISDKHIDSRYLLNLDILARACRRTGREMWFFVQSMPFNIVRRTPTLADMRFQMYACLAFGAKKIMHFCYATPPSGAEVFPFALIDAKAEKTELWDICFKVNHEIKYFAEIYEKFTYLGTFAYKKNPPSYLAINDSYNSEILTINDSDESLIIGCFENNGKKAFVMVNMSEPSDGRKTDVKFTLNASDAVIYKQGTKDKLTDSNGIYSLSLESGEGVFIELL